MVGVPVVVRVPQFEKPWSRKHRPSVLLSKLIHSQQMLTPIRKHTNSFVEVRNWWSTPVLNTQ
jgi:hypothetical protein